jgi:hypothetical protein
MESRRWGLQPGGNDKIPEAQATAPALRSVRGRGTRCTRDQGKVKGHGQEGRPGHGMSSMLEKICSLGRWVPRIGAPDAGLQEFSQLTIKSKVRQLNSL